MNDRGIRDDGPGHPIPKISSIEFALTIAGLGVLYVLLYATQMIWSPMVLIIALVVILSPLRTIPAIKNIIIFASIIFAIWLVKTLQMVLAPFVIALLLSYLLHPIVSRLEKRNIPRWASTLFIIICALAIIVLLLIGIVPMIIQQLGSILQTFSAITSQFSNWLLNGSMFRTLHRFGVSNGQLHQFLTDTIAPRVQDVLKAILQGAFGLVSEFSAVLTGIVNIVIIPFLTFFMLKDFPLMKHRVKMLIPRAHREKAVVYYSYIEDILGRYLRGAMIIAIFDGITVSTLFWLIGIPYSMVLGLMSGFLSFIPYFGFLTMLAITTVASTLEPDQVLLHMLLGMGVVSSLHVIETYVLAPKIIGSKLGLHPVILILSLFVFGYFFGFLGFLIAIPLASIIITLVTEWEKKRRANGIQEEDADAGSQPSETTL